MAVADVVGQLTGREPSQIGIELRGIFTKSVSHRGDVYFFDGTSPEDMVLLLEKYGIQSTLTTGNTMQTLEQDLAGGHKVIAAVNAETIWNYPRARDSGPRLTTPSSSPVSTPAPTSSTSTTAASPPAAMSGCRWPPSPKPGPPATTCSSSHKKPTTSNERTLAAGRAPVRVLPAGHRDDQAPVAAAAWVPRCSAPRKHDRRTARRSAAAEPARVDQQVP